MIKLLLFNGGLHHKSFSPRRDRFSHKRSLHHQLSVRRSHTNLLFIFSLDLLTTTSELRATAQHFAKSELQVGNQQTMTYEIHIPEIASKSLIISRSSIRFRRLCDGRTAAAQSWLTNRLRLGSCRNSTTTVWYC